MAKKTSYKLQPQDERIVHVFSELGMPKNLAKTLMYISHVDECRSAEIERGANLRQPEVSIAMQHLQDKGWIEKRDLKKKGKGRPVHIYSLKAPLPTIMKRFEQEKLREVESVKKDLSSLRLL
ncbi:MAG: ArsR family transcriptional regulator, partial [Candidatus Thermoplasmatota archaeon]|nr:ArsR family transcriptional regulator [Candidatus Thermoplasmatota archaeon]